MSWIRKTRTLTHSKSVARSLNSRTDRAQCNVEHLEDRLLLASVVSQFFFGELNKISDNSGEFFYNRVGGNTTVDVGDVLLTGFQIETIENLTTPSPTRTFLAGSGNNEFAGFSAIEVTGVTPVPTGFLINFGPVSAAARTAIASDPNLGVTSGLLSSMTSTGMLTLFDDGPTHDYTRLFNAAFPGPDDIPPGPSNPGDI